MSTTILDVTTDRPRRVLRWTAIIGGATATAVVIGLLTAHSTATDVKAGARASLSQPAVAPGLVTFEIVPSPVIGTNARFFFGTGDGSVGYYSE